MRKMQIDDYDYLTLREVREKFRPHSEERQKIEYEMVHGAFSGDESWTVAKVILKNKYPDLRWG
jgi:hypothetical protein